MVPPPLIPVAKLLVRQGCATCPARPGIVAGAGGAGLLVGSTGNLFFSQMHLHGGPAPVRRFLPELIELIYNRDIDPGKVFDLALPLEQVAEGYQAMDERRAIKVLLQP